MPVCISGPWCMFLLSFCVILHVILNIEHVFNDNNLVDIASECCTSVILWMCEYVVDSSLLIRHVSTDRFDAVRPRYTHESERRGRHCCILRTGGHLLWKTQRHQYLLHSHTGVSYGQIQTLWTLVTVGWLILTDFFFFCTDLLMLLIWKRNIWDGTLSMETTITKGSQTVTIVSNDRFWSFLLLSFILFIVITDVGAFLQ